MAARRRRILVCGTLAWAQKELHDLLDAFADIIRLDSPDRADFLVGFMPGGKYDGTVGIYRDNNSKPAIGPFDAEIIRALGQSSVKWIAHNGAGYDQIDVSECARQNISVSNTPGAVDEATATTALYLILSTLRHFSKGERSLFAGTWNTPISDADTHDLSTRTVGILGLGGIGLCLAHLLHAFPDVRVVYHNRNRAADAPAWCTYVDTLEGLCQQADVLSVHVPLKAETVHLVGEKEIRALKRGSILVNTARGKVIDEEAMIRALEDGHLSAVGLDVFPDEPAVNPRLLEFPQNCLLPHMGTENQDSRRRMEVRAITNLRDFLRDGKGKDLVPELRSKL